MRQVCVAGSLRNIRHVTDIAHELTMKPGTTAQARRAAQETMDNGKGAYSSVYSMIYIKTFDWDNPAMAFSLHSEGE
jgi:hypothetical protein